MIYAKAELSLRDRFAAATELVRAAAQGVRAKVTEVTEVTENLSAS